MLRALSTLALCAFANAQLQESHAWSGSPVNPTSNDVMTTPVVADLDGDGVAEIMFVSYTSSGQLSSGNGGILRVVSGSDCSDVFSSVAVGTVTAADGASLTFSNGAVLVPSSGLAVADIDSDGRPEILGMLASKSRIMAWEHDGTLKWVSGATVTPLTLVAGLAVADIDQDGQPEIACGATVWRADGTVAWSQSSTDRSTSIVDLDQDGSSEVLVGGRALRADGSLYWTSVYGGSRHAIADFDLDGAPEVVMSGTTLAILEFDGSFRCSIPSGALGNPAVADVDGDCIPEIAVASGSQMRLFRYDPVAVNLTAVWQRPVNDPSSGVTGCTMADLDGDGRAEVLFNDHTTLWVFDGATGATIHATPNTTGTSTETVAVADVDGDGDAEVIACANQFAGPGFEGVRVFHDPNAIWADARPIFNQRSYHVTNIEDDGSVPVAERPSWLAHNNYVAQITRPFGVSSTGSGCASQSTFQQPELTNVAGTGPWLGTTLQLQVSDQPSQGSLSPFAFLVADVANPSLPLAVLGRPECTLRAGLAGDLISAPVTGGVATWSIAIPTSPSLRGTLLFAQAVAFEFAGAGQSIIDALSNGVQCVLCGP